MSAQTASGGAGADASSTPPKPPGIDESLRELNAARREAVDATRGSARELRRLFAADFALARSAFGRGLAWSGAAIVFGASGWLLLTGALIALLQGWGLSWLQSLSLGAVVNVAAAGFAAWRVGRYFDYTGMHATRRQLSRLGLFEEDAVVEDDPPPPGTAHDARPAQHGGP